VSQPSLTILKRLFALSGNQCAFPGCTASIIQGGTVIGHVCHIKGANARSARYDAQQNDSDRHAYDNLILLCSPHHKIIDSNSRDYSVEQLQKMKLEHEQRATAMSDAETETGARLLIQHSVTSIGQTGGVTAQSVTIQNYYEAPAFPNPARLQHPAHSTIGYQANIPVRAPRASPAPALARAPKNPLHKAVGEAPLVVNAVEAVVLSLLWISYPLCGLLQGGWDNSHWYYIALRECILCVVGGLLVGFIARTLQRSRKHWITLLVLTILCTVLSHQKSFNAIVSVFLVSAVPVSFVCALGARYVSRFETRSPV
jgi:hypothetical protein